MSRKGQKSDGKRKKPAEWRAKTVLFRVQGYSRGARKYPTCHRPASRRCSAWDNRTPFARKRTKRASRGPQPTKKARRMASFFVGWGAGIRTPEMSESESDALPLGDTPILRTEVIIAKKEMFVNTFFKKSFCRTKFLAKTLSRATLCGIISPLRARFMRRRSYFYPWHSWIARQTPTLKVEGSNPFG